jgi:transcriptional regulator with XRE-family HTH domain
VTTAKTKATAKPRRRSTARRSDHQQLDAYYHRLGVLLRAQRERVGWTQADLGALVGKTRAWASAVESGVRRISVFELDLLTGALRRAGQAVRRRAARAEADAAATPAAPVSPAFGTDRAVDLAALATLARAVEPLRRATTEDFVAGHAGRVGIMLGIDEAAALQHALAGVFGDVSGDTPG